MYLNEHNKRHSNMKRLVLLLAFSVLAIFSNAQNVNVFNGYKYIYLPPLEYQNGRIDIYGISAEARGYFQEKGFGIITDISDLSKLFKEIQENPCIVLTCYIQHPAPNAMSNTVTISFYDCYNQLVYKTKGSGSMGMDISGDYRIATKKALREFRNNTYSYNPALTPKIVYPEVEKTEETEESLKEYFSNNILNPIEGIYKSYQSETLGYYKIGIKKIENVYKAIIIESEHKHWKTGEVKAIFEPSSMKGFYSTKWFMRNKTEEETFALLESGVILSIEFENPKTKEKVTSKFIKMYPPAEGDVIFNKVQKSSGSGFFLTSAGIIATNAHVVENAETIKVQIFNEIGNFEYTAKVLLTDNKNDVALLKIDDEKFKGMSEIPYSLIEKAEIGEKAFTIGYPLNDVMGTNYKVTDGIVSSVSGINDDMRYYQISVPLQPGNSGGPLFNSSGDIIGITSARLNSKAVGIEVENVNYAIKISYLLNLYNMLPNSENLNTTPTETSKELQEQVKILKNYVCLIKVN